MNAGNLEHCLGRQDEAEKYYRKAVWTDPNHAEANYNLANIMEDKGDPSNALLFYKKAVHEDPDFADAHFNLARILQGVGQLKEARQHWLSYLRLKPDADTAQEIKGLLEI